MEYAASVHCFNGVMYRFILLYGLLDVITVTVLYTIIISLNGYNHKWCSHTHTHGCIL